MSTKTVVILLLITALVSSTIAATDLTVQPKAIGEDVVKAVLDKIHDSRIFHDDYYFLERIAFVETLFGEDQNTFPPGYTGGIWHLDEDKYIATKDASLKQIHDKILNSFGLDWTKTTWNDLLKPLYSGLAARLFISTLEAKNSIIPATLLPQAEYWVLLYTSRVDATVELFYGMAADLEYRANCKGKQQVLVLLDGSADVGQLNFNSSLDFVAQFFSSFDLENTQVGLIQFSKDINVVFPVENGFTTATIEEQVKKARYLNQFDRNINDGIVKAVQIYGETKQRQGVPRILILITSGGFTDTVGIPDIDKAKKANLVTFSVGVGSKVNDEELSKFAYNDPNHIFKLTEFETFEIRNNVNRLNRETCRIPQKHKVNEAIEPDYLIQNEYRYFDFELPQDGLSVLTEPGASAKIEGYYSYTVKNPSSALNDGVLNSAGKTFIPRVKGSQSNVFVAIKGLSQRNNYFKIQIQKGDVEKELPSSTLPTTLVPEEPSSTDSAEHHYLNLFLMLIPLTLISLNIFL